MMTLNQLKRLNGNMKKTLVKYLFKKIKSNLSGFLTISLIVALGIGFLIGLTITTDDLQLSIDSYYNQYNIADINMKSSIGFAKEGSIEKIKESLGNNIKDIEINYQVDKEVIYENSNVVARLIYKDFNDTIINNIELKEGTLPSNDNEILVEETSQYILDIDINKTITIESNEYKVVGIAKNPLYLSHERETSTVGKGRLDTIIYLKDSLIEDKTIYTDINIRLNIKTKNNTFSDEYFNEISTYKTKLEELKGDLFSLTLKEITGYDVPTNIASGSGTLYVLDRKDNTSFYFYNMQSNKVSSVAIVFPIFFIIIAALITVSTLERMVSEDRINIGTLKSLGYSKFSILSTYTSYSFLSILIGIIIGSLIGLFLLPYIICIVFCSLFYIPSFTFSINILIYLLSILLMSFAILITTILSAYKIVREKPNALLTQKPIKSGKKILLEHITFFWNKLKFKYKSTIRNLFRFKKNAIMMIIGIAGSTALVLGAFGVGDSLSDITSSQYNDILKYNTIIELNTYKEEQNPLNNFSVSNQGVFYKISGFCKENEDLEFNLIADVNGNDFNNFFNFKEDKKSISMTDNEIFVSKQISYMLNLKINDSFIIKINNFEYALRVDGIFDNYVENYILVGNKIISQVFKGLNTSINCYLANVDKISESSAQDELIKEVSALDYVKSIDLTYHASASYNNVLSSLKLIVLVLIIFAGLLEIASIYSLTNVSITERVREIATLKVLGYRRKEVVGYIYRETTILALIGEILGFLLGYIFHKFVIERMLTVGLFLGLNIKPISYLYAFLISSLFIFIVDIIFLPKFKNLSMTESLKSVE